MHPHRGLEEVHVGKRPGLGIEFADIERFLKGLSDGLFVLLLDPDQDQVDVPAFQGFGAAVTTGPSRTSQWAKDETGSSRKRKNNAANPKMTILTFFMLFSPFFSCLSTFSPT